MNRTDYIEEPYTENDNSTIWQNDGHEEDGARLISPMQLNKKKFVKKLSRSNQRTKSDNKKRKSINIDYKNASMNSYFSHINAGTNGYNAYIRA